MQQVNSGVAYILWFLCVFGICGGQRFYTGNVASGLIYLFTFGVFGVGQLLDLAFIPGMVNRRNIYLRGLGVGNATSVTLNLSNVPQPRQPQATQSSASMAGTPMQRLLKAAKANGGQLSIAQAAMHTELEPEEVKQLLHQAEKNGYAEIGNDPNTGAIRYYFDL